MLTVVLPCYNEIESIASFQKELFPALESLDTDYEVLAVDDGSSDGTGAALAALAKTRPDLRVLTHATNRGLGCALRTGLDAARGEWLVFLDADLTFHPAHIARLLEAQRELDADCVCGSPFLGRGASGVPWSRRLPSLLINAFYRGLFFLKFTAYTPMFRLYRARPLRGVPLRSSGFEISAEILVRLVRAKARIAEIPVPLGKRSAGQSKLRRLRELKNHAALMASLLLDSPANPASRGLGP